MTRRDRTERWHQSRPTAAIMAGITPDDVTLFMRRTVLAPDSYQVSCLELDDLRLIRDAAVARDFGCTFAEANAQGRALDWFDAMTNYPTPEEALEERFGPAALWNGLSEDAAITSWRAAAWARVAGELVRAA